MNTTEQILLTLGARNEASGVFGQVDRDAKNMASSISSAFASVNSGMMNLGAVTDNIMQGLTGKSALDNILGTSSKAETNKVLLNNMTETKKGAEDLYNTVDKVTDSSLTSMQELIPAMKAFKSATGASDKEMNNITDDMANFGAAVLAQTGSTDLAQQSMMDLGKGIKGAYASLDQYGITEAALKRTGYWNGDEKDVEGFMKAVSKVTGSTKELMETNQGLDALIGKSFSRAGKKIGNEFLPVLKDIKRGFIDLDDSVGGGIAASILMLSAGVETANNAFWNISTTVNGFKDLGNAFQFVTNKIKGVEKAAESAGDALNTMSNISDIGAMGATVADAGSVTKDVSAGKKVVEVSPEILEAASFASSGFGYNAGSTLEEIGKYAGTEKITEKDALKLLNEGIESQKTIGNKKIEYSKILQGVEKQDLKLSQFLKESAGVKINAASESFQNTLKSLCDVPSNVGNKLTSSGKSLKESINSFSDSLKQIKTDGISGNFEKLDKKLFNVLKGTNEINEVVDDVGDLGKTISGAEEIADVTTGLAGAGAAVGAAGPEAAAASVAIEETAVATTTLSGAFTSMIIPLLAISAVIAIMIPIATGLVIEALLFLNIVQQVFAAMNFGDVDLKNNIDGIKQLAEGIAWIGVAMGSMTFTGIMTGLAVITGGFLGITGPLQIAVDALAKASELLKQFDTTGIDPNVATNITSVAEALGAVANAMSALTWTNISTGFSNFIAGALDFGSVTEGLEQAKNDIINASTKLNEFSGMTPLDDGVAQNIKNVCDSLASVGDAIGALRSIRDGQNWDDLIGGFIGGIFGEGVDIQTALLNVKDDIVRASQSLAQFSGISDIPDGVADKIKKVSDTLTSVNDAFNTLRGMRDNSSWDEWMGGLFGGVDIATSLDQIKNDLMIASQKLAELSAMSEITDDTTTKIANVGTALTKVSEVCSTLTNLPPMESFDPTQISTAVTNVQTAANELTKLNETTFSSDSVNSVLNNVKTALENLKTTLSSASGFSGVSLGIGSQIVSGVQTGLAPLGPGVQGKVASAIGSAKPTANTYGKGLGFNATQGFRSTLKLADVMRTEMGYVKTAVDNGIGAAKIAAQNGAAEVVEAFKNGIDAHSPGLIARTMKGEMNYTREAILNAYPLLKESAYNAASLIAESFGKPSLDFNALENNGRLTAEHINALKTTITKSPDNTNQKSVTIIVQEGAVAVDARNKTEREARGIMTLALESLDNITNIDVDGVGY